MDSGFYISEINNSRCNFGAKDKTLYYKEDYKMHPVLGGIWQMLLLNGINIAAEH